MPARSFVVASVLALGLSGLAQAETSTTWTDPGAPRAAQADAPRTVTAQAEPPRTQRPAARPRAGRRPPGYRSARYRGGDGATWKTGRDAYGFAGSYGGCSYRGHAGPGGYRLDRRC